MEGVRRLIDHADQHGRELAVPQKRTDPFVHFAQMLGRIEVAQVHLAQDRMQPEGVERRPDAMPGEVHQPDDQPVAVVTPQVPEVASQLRRRLEMSRQAQPKVSPGLSQPRRRRQQPFLHAPRQRQLRLPAVAVLLQVAQKRLVFQVNPDARQQLRRVDRLGHEVGGAGGERVLPVVRTGQAALHQDRQVLPGRIGPDLTADLEPVHLRHHQVEQHQVRRSFPDPGERIDAILRRADIGEAATLKHRHQKVPVDPVVIDNQNPGVPDIDRSG